MVDSKILFTTMEDEKLVEIVAKHPCLYDLHNPIHKDYVVKDNAWEEVAEHLGRSEQDCRKRWRNIRDTHNRRNRKSKGTGASGSRKSQKWALAKMLSFLHKEEHKHPSMPNIGRDSTNSNDIDDSANMECEDHYDINETVNAVQESSKHSVLPPGTSPDSRPTSDTESPIPKHLSTPNAGLCCRPIKLERFYDNTPKLMEERSSEHYQIFKIQCQRQEDSVDLFFRSIAMSVKKLRPELINEVKMSTLQLVVELENRHANTVLH